DRVLALLVELDLLAELANGAVRADAREPLAPEIEKQLLVLALTPPDDGRQHDEPGARRLGHDAIDHLLDGLGGDHPVAARAVRAPQARVEPEQVVEDLGDGPARR